MVRTRFELTFHRAAHTAQPEAFVFEPQRYSRHEGKAAAGDAAFPWSEELLDQLSRLQRKASDAGARRRVGAILREFLQAVSWNIPEDELLRAPAKGQGPILLTFSAGAAELYALPWELATLPGSNRYLAELPHVFLRYEWPGLSYEAPAITDDTSPRMILAWSAAGGAVPAGEHVRVIRDAIEQQRARGVELQEVPHVSGHALEEALAQDRGPVALHVLCHGALRGDDGARFAALCWNQGSGAGTGEIDGDRLRALLAPHRGRLRLVVLCACLSSDHDPLNVYMGSLAQVIHRLGVPAVVASRYPLSVPGSVRLTRVLYRAMLVEGMSLETALLKARAALQSERGIAPGEEEGDREGPLFGDAYALQLYARSEEAVRAEDGTLARRDVTATYPFARQGGGKKAPFHIPFFKNEGFVGRDDDLAALHTLLQQGEAVGVRPAPGGAHPAALTGMGGIGKTQLAVEYAYRYRDEYPGGVYWVNGTQRWQAELAALAEKLGLHDDSAAEETRQRRLALAFARYLEEHPGALVIFDNVEDPLALREPSPDIIPAQLSCRLLFTTRRRDPDSPFATLDVPVLPPDAALRLLLSSEARRRLLDGGPESEVQAAKAICSALGYLPLAVVLAAAYLGKFGRIPLSSYLLRLRDEGALAAADAAKVDPRKLGTHHPAAVEATLRAQWDALESEDARRVLKTAALLREAAQVQRATLSLLTGLGDEAKDGYPAPLEEALHELSGLALVEDLTERAIRLHPLVREFAEKRIDRWETFAAECGERLCGALWDMRRLHEEVTARGVYAVLADLLEGARLWGAAGEARSQWLIRPLIREAHCLRRWDPVKEPGFLLQQLRNRSFEMRIDSLQAVSEGELDEQRWIHLRERIQICRESDALVCTLEGHIYRVTSVAVTSDGRFAISASADDTLKVWELSTGQIVRTLEGHNIIVNSVAVTSDGRFAVSASSDKMLKVWELSTGQIVRTLEGHTDIVNSVAVTPDGRFAVSASSDKTLKVWELSTGQIVRTLEGHTDIVNSVAVTPIGRLAVSASSDKTLKVWELSTGQAIRTLVGHTYGVNGVAVTPDGLVAVSASDDHTLKLWELSTGQAVHTFEGHTNGVKGVAVAPDGGFAISASYDETLKMWELPTAHIVCTLRGHTDEVVGVAVTPDRRFAISASSDKTLKVWELSPRQAASALQGHKRGVNDVVLTPDGRFAVSASSDNTLKVWELSTGQVVRTLEGHTHGVRRVVVTPDGRLAISLSWNNILVVWELVTGQAIRTIQDRTTLVEGVTVTPDGRYVIFASHDGMLKVWELSTGRHVRTLKGHTSIVYGAVVTPDGRYVVSASHDYTLKVWDLATGEVIRTLEGHTHPVLSAAVTSDGRLAVSASSDKTLKVWDLATGQPIRTLEGHSHLIDGVALTPDDRFAVSASMDKTLKVWELSTGQPIMTLETHTPLQCCAVTPNGKTFLTGDKAGALHILDWHYPPQPAL